MTTYGIPAGSNITYGSPGFPQWVYPLAAAFNLQASTYPGHQESERAEAGFAPNPQHLNRGIDWAGSISDMQRFADYLLAQRSFMEQVIWENPDTGQHVGVAGGDDVTDTPYYADDYPNHRDHVHTRQSQPIPMPGTSQPIPPSNRPAFTEIPVWSNNNQSRDGTRIDLFAIHTQEGGDGDAEGLAHWLDANGVSYHYTVSTGQPTVTVCDVVDTDLASWSVLSANNRSINLCFAGSKVSWSRQQWLDNTAAIDVAAYLAVQDCRKYGIPVEVIAPPYTSGRAGITDHNYVTKVLGDGTHTDVGPNFPWDVFAASVAKYSGTAPAPVPSTPTLGGFLMALTDAEQREVLELLRQQASYRKPSRSPLRHVGEGVVDTVAGFELNTDAATHVLLVQALARLGDPDSTALLREVANLDPARYPDRAHDRLLAKAILNDVAGIGTVGSTPATGVTPGVTPVATVSAESAPPPVPSVPPATAVTAVATGTDGGLFGSIQALQKQLDGVSAAVKQITEG